MNLPTYLPNHMTIVYSTLKAAHLDLLDEFLLVQENDLHMEGFDDRPAAHLEALLHAPHGLHIPHNLHNHKHNHPLTRFRRAHGTARREGLPATGLVGA